MSWRVTHRSKTLLSNNWFYTDPFGESTDLTVLVTKILLEPGFPKVGEASSSVRESSIELSSVCILSMTDLMSGSAVGRYGSPPLAILEVDFIILCFLLSSAWGLNVLLIFVMPFFAVNLGVNIGKLVSWLSGNINSHYPTFFMGGRGAKWPSLIKRLFRSSSFFLLNCLEAEAIQVFSDNYVLALNRSSASLDQAFPERLFSYWVWFLFPHSGTHGTQTCQTSPINYQIWPNFIEFEFVDIFQRVY